MEGLYFMETQSHPTLDYPLIEKNLGEVVDAAGKTLSVWSCDQIGGTRAFSLFLKTYSELSQEGFAGPYAGWDQSNGNKVSVVYLYDSEARQVAGGIAFEYRPVVKEGWIILSFTDTIYRGRRINQLAHQYFEEVVRARGGNKIGSHVHVTNQSRLRSALRAGMRPEYYRMAKYI